MFHSYEEALDWIHSRLRLGIKPGLKRMEWMLDKLGNPENNLKAIHVGGTNGKGSIVAFLRSILNKAGYKTGTFTSPYIEQFNERISIDGKMISDSEITELTNLIKPLADELEATELGAPTEFEVITAMALFYFAKINPVDIAIVEVGLGGRFDSTNVIKPLASIITNVGMDHTQILGNTIKEIAYEKAGIIKQHTPLITCVRTEEAFSVIKKEAEAKNAQIIQLETDFFSSAYKPIKSGEQFTFTYRDIQLNKLTLSLIGQHQIENAAGAIATLCYLNAEGHIHIDEMDVRAGLKTAYWPGRFELLREHPTVIMDGAHNPEGMQSFVNVMANRFNGKKTKIIFAALKDKDLTNMLSILNSLNADIYFTDFDFPRSVSADELKQISKNRKAKAESNWSILIKELISTLGQDEILAVTGSLYFISTIKPELEKMVNRI